MKQIALKMKKSQTESDSTQYKEQSVRWYCVLLTYGVLILINRRTLFKPIFFWKETNL